MDYHLKFDHHIQGPTKESEKNRSISLTLVENEILSLAIHYKKTSFEEDLLTVSSKAVTIIWDMLIMAEKGDQGKTSRFDSQKLEWKCLYSNDQNIAKKEEKKLTKYQELGIETNK